MKTLTDAFGKDLQVGDTVIYTVRKHSSMGIRHAVIISIHDYGEKAWERYTLSVFATKKNWRNIEHSYNTVIYSNDTLVRMNER